MRISDWSSDVCSSDLLIVPVPGQGLFANVEAPPLSIAMAKAQLALQQLRIPGPPLLLAQAVIVIGDFAVQQDFPEVLAHLVQFGAASSEERRVGIECVGTCRSRGYPEHMNKNKTRYY